MILFRRYLVTLALLMWLGGFLFYSTIVIPIGRSVLRPPSHQTFVTREVTKIVDYFGAASMVILLWDTMATRSHRKSRGILWIGMTLTVAALAWVRVHLASYMDPETMTITDREAIRPYHLGYIIIGGAQMILGLIYIGVTLRSWHRVEG